MQSVSGCRASCLLSVFFVAGAAFVAIAPREARGQLLQGAIGGNVTDSSQAAISGAQVVAADQATGFSRQTVTNSTGAYNMPVLPPGTYNVTIRSAGFQTYTRTGVVVSAETVTRVDAALEVGAVTENVTVTAAAATLQSDRADVRSELGAQLLSTLPVPIGRNYQMVFTTIPGVSPPQNSHSFSANGSRSLAFTVNGGNVNANDTRVDGAGTRNYSATDVILYIPSLDAIETVNVATSSFDADQSAGGAFVNGQERHQRIPWLVVRDPCRPAPGGIPMGGESHAAETAFH